MSSRCAGFGARRSLRLIIVRRNLFLSQPAAPRVITSVHQNAEGPGNKSRLAAKTGDAALHLQKRFLDRVFGVGGAAENIAREVLHARAVQRIEALVGT